MTAAAAPRVVYDTMIFFQWAAQPPGRLHATAKAVLNGSARLMLSAGLLAEIEDLLNRPAIRARSRQLSTDRVELFIERLKQLGELVTPIPNAFTWPEHPDDDHVFNLAIAAGAHYLVTWETRILNLATDSSPDADKLRRLAPQLKLLNPPEFVATLTGNP